MKLIACQCYLHFRSINIMIDHSANGMEKFLENLPNKDWLYSIQLNRWFLKPIGAWPLSLCDSTSEKISSVILTLISCFLIGFLLIPCALCTFLDTEGDLDSKIKMFGPLSFCLMATVKYYILVSRGDQIAKCVRNVHLDWNYLEIEKRDNDRLIMMECAKFGRFMATFCAAFMYSGGFFYTTVMPLFAQRTEIIDNETVRLQAFPVYRRLLDPQTTPSFEIVQLLQGLGAFVLYSVTISACSLAAVFVMHVCGQFQIVTAKLNELVDGGGKNGVDTFERRLGDTVEHHLRIIKFIYRIEALLNEICLVEIVGCTLNICFLTYYLLTEWEQSEAIGTFTYCMFIVSLTFNIFILCYIGEILSEECNKVGLSAYMVDWYRLPSKRALDLILLIAISNISIKLTAGKLISLSLASFCSVIKTSMGYLSLLRTLTA